MMMKVETPALLCNNGSMTQEEKIACFKRELEYIDNLRYRKSAEVLIGLLPDYFFSVAASSTGRYHPQFALGNGGLLRHTKTAVRIAKEMFGSESLTGGYSKDEKNLMIIALIVHDGLKYGVEKSESTKFEHPVLICDYIKENKDKTMFTDEDVQFLTHVISSHMGAYNTNENSEIVLNKPETSPQLFVHACDYLASRKFLDVKFDENNNIVE